VSSLACCLVISTGTCTSHSHPSTACTEQEASGGPSGSRTNGHESDQPLWIIGDSERDARRWVPTDREAPVVVVAAVSRTSGRPVLPAPRPGWNLHLRVPIPIGELKPLARAQRIGSRDQHHHPTILPRLGLECALARRTCAAFDRGAVLTKRSVRARRRISRCLIDVRASVRRGAARCDAARSARHRRPSDFCGRTTAA